MNRESKDYSNSGGKDHAESSADNEQVHGQLPESPRGTEALQRDDLTTGSISDSTEAAGTDENTSGSISVGSDYAAAACEHCVAVVGPHSAAAASQIGVVAVGSGGAAATSDAANASDVLIAGNRAMLDRQDRHK